MNDLPRGASGAPDRNEAGETKPVAVTPRPDVAVAPPTPLKPLVMVGEDAGACTGNACEIPVRKDRGEVQ